ncbi:MAG TPA: SDR family oxidoreductase [Amycolatopsis sp.]|jgi:NAD(P)-dependent dehydrogenase (short-subunit alcohol dehydrogenase family)
MDLGLKGRTAVVTGASRGIGLAVTRRLVDEGVLVVAGARRSTPELAELGDAVRVVEVDLAEPGGPGELVAAAGERVDILVNNVGSAPARTGGFLSVTDELWARSLELNLMAAVRATRAVLPGMLAAGRGSIITISSVNSTLADPAVIDYGAAKAALANFCKALAREVGGDGVRVNTISPGPVATALWLGEGGVADTVSRATGQSADDVVRGAAKDSVTGRFTQPEEVADAVLYLAGDRSANVTGADLRIDGGLIPTW